MYSIFILAFNVRYKVKFVTLFLESWWHPNCHIMYVKYEQTFNPKFTVKNLLTNESRPFKSNYKLTVLNGGWLDIDPDTNQFLVPNFDTVERCKQYNEKLLDGRDRHISISKVKIAQYFVNL
jgi:hypothetical protein